MDRPSGESTPSSTGPPDRQTLRLIERHLDSDPIVAETEFDPDAYEPRLLQALLDVGRYPDPILAARIDIRWFTTQDFSFHYLEEHEDGELWECRWDRHPNAHNTRVHFHNPPSASKITDLDLPSIHPLEVYSTVLVAIEQRMDTLWESL